MLSALLSKEERVLKPFRSFTAVFESIQLDQNPVFVSLLHSDFPFSPELTIERSKIGRYTIFIDNYNKLGVPITNNQNVSIEYITSNSQLGKLHARLSSDQIEINNTDLGFQSLDDFLGLFVVSFYIYY